MKKFNLTIAVVLAAVMIVSVVSLPAHAAKPVKNLEDLKSAVVGVQKDSVSEILVTALKESSKDVTAFDEISEIVEALKSGKVDAAIMDETPARYFLNNEEGLALLPDPLATEVYAIAFKKGNKDLCEKVNKAIKELQDEGKIIEIVKKYTDGTDIDPSTIDFNKAPDREKLWVGCAASFPPYEVRSPEGFSGIDIEICAEIAKKLGVELVVCDYRFDVLFAALTAGKIDMICSAITVTEDRSKVVDFSDPYEANQELVIIPAEAAPEK